MAPRPRCMAIDPGERRWGIAVSDEDGELAHPRPVLTPKDEASAIEAVRVIANDEGVRVLVLGLPLELSGREGPMAKKARALGARLAEALGLDVAMWDERLSSVAASRALSSQGLSQKKQRGKLDSVAAAMLLGSFLEARDEVRARAITFRAGKTP
ncbi:MAG: Holliday junction resolvase RuvX [Sandaracinaceae bacterium]|nr:Holliday junction resolvase RuvX [Sandaracinaceae bacterium]